MRFHRHAVVLALVAATSCGGATGPKTVNLTGTWKGDFRGYPLTVNIAQEGTKLTGIGTWEASLVEPFTATGTFVDPDVSLTFNPSPYVGWTLIGQQQNGRTISGMAGSVSIGTGPLVLTRQ